MTDVQLMFACLTAGVATGFLMRAAGLIMPYRRNH